MSKIVISRLPHFADTLIGRDAELQRLDHAWNDPAQHVLVICGIGGEGKTRLSATLGEFRLWPCQSGPTPGVGSF